MKKQEEVKVVQEAAPQTNEGMEKHAYPKEFMSMMMDYAYEALRQHLLAVGARAEAIDLVENIIIMHQIEMVYCENEKVPYFWNQNAGETIGYISRAVVKLGGRFAPAPLDMIK